VNDIIDEVYAGTLPEPIEVNLLRSFLGLGSDLFGNATNISDQVDPFYLAPGGADPTHPNGGFQFTPELAIAIGILQVRNFGLGGFNEADRLNELQALIGVHGTTAGTEIWDDRNFLVDPLAPVSVPDSRTPGFGGPLSRLDPKKVIAVAKNFPKFDYLGSGTERKELRAKRELVATRLGAWPKLGSYGWMIGGGKSASGSPWIGGFPQTGFQTPSIMHFMEHRSAEGSDHQIEAAGMEFVGGPFILIGHTDSVAYTTTTAQLRLIDTFFEEVVGENADAIRYDDEGTPAALVQRTETILGSPTSQLVVFRSHERNGNGGTRPIVDWIGDAEGTVDSAGGTTLTDSGAFGASFGGGHVAIVDGTGAGQIRAVASASGSTLNLGSSWTTTPDTTSEYVAVRSGNTIIAEALDSPVWLEESLSALAFSEFQRAETILDIRSAVRMIPSTHNFLAADNKGFNRLGTQSGKGNIGYWSSGFSRIRQGGEDSRLPLDGTVANPLVVASGTVGSSTITTLTATGTPFSGENFTPPAVNARYDSPDAPATEFIVSITSGTGFKQTRRIAANTDGTLTIEAGWGVNPDPGDTFEVYEILAIPEAINPSEGYTSNWNNKAATRDEGADFGRQHRTVFISERLDPENAWTLGKQVVLNDDLAGLDSDGAFGRFIVPRLREAVTAVGDGGNLDIEPVLAALEAQNGSPEFGRLLVDPVFDTTRAGELAFLRNLINDLAATIYGDEYAGAISVPGGDDALHLVQHAIDSAAGNVTGAYVQAYSGDYFNGSAWEVVVRDRLGALASSGIPADSPRGETTYEHTLASVFAELIFDPTPLGNRGVWEQIVEAGNTVRGVFIFPLGQSGHIEGGFPVPGVTSIDPHNTSIHPIWRDWRFLPILRVSKDLASGGADNDGDGVWDGFERWYFGSTVPKGTDDFDGDGATLLEEFMDGSDPNNPDTDEDGFIDGFDSEPQDRLLADPVSTSVQLLLGKTLVVKDKDGDATKRRIILVSKDPAISLPPPASAGSPVANGATLTIINPDTPEQIDINLPASEWKGLGRKPVGKGGYKYIDRDLDDGPCKTVVLKPGKLIRVVCKGAGIGFTLDEPSQTRIAVELVLGSGQGDARYCMEFSGSPPVNIKNTPATAGGVGVFKSKDPLAPGACALP
jgi:hypothetical protein